MQIAFIIHHYILIINLRMVVIGFVRRLIDINQVHVYFKFGRIVSMGANDKLNKSTRNIL